MANFDDQFPLNAGECCSAGPQGFDGEVDSDVFGSVLAHRLIGPARKRPALSPQQDRLIRRALANCPVDVIDNIGKKKKP